jgi:hypothetical protein
MFAISSLLFFSFVGICFFTNQTASVYILNKINYSIASAAGLTVQKIEQTDFTTLISLPKIEDLKPSTISTWTKNNFFETVDDYRNLFIAIGGEISRGIIAINQFDKKNALHNSISRKESDLTSQALRLEHQDKLVKIFSDFVCIFKNGSINFSQSVDSLAEQIRQSDSVRKNIYLMSLQKTNIISLAKIKLALADLTALSQRIFTLNASDKNLTASVSSVNKHNNSISKINNDMEIIDEVTGDTYCIKIRNGELISVIGNCNTSTDLVIDSN